MMMLRSSFLSFILILSSFSASTQAALFLDQEKSPYSVLLRGKVLGGGVLEDYKNLNYTIGVEQRFLNYHSVGVDYVYMRGRAEYESQDTITHEYYDNGFCDFDRRHYLLVDYRFYFNFFQKSTRWLPYFNIVSKFGKREMWYQYRSILSRTAPYFHQSSFQEVGLAIGSHISFDYENLLFDFSIGCLRSYSQVHFQDLTMNPEINEFGVDPLRPWKLHARINLSWYLFRL